MPNTPDNKAQKEQRTEEKRYQTYIEYANDSIFSLDKTGIILSVNRVFCEVTGYTAEELVGQSPLMLVAPESQASTAQALSTILSGRSIQQYELKIITKSGQRRLIEVRGRLITEGGKVIETFQIARDITERRRAEKEARRRALEQETLREAVLILAKSLNRDEVVAEILTQLQAVVPYDTASVQLLTGNALEIVGGRGFTDLQTLRGIKFAVDDVEHPNHKVVQQRKPIIIPDVCAIYNDFQRTPYTDIPIRSWLGVPMLIGDRLIGMIALDKYERDFYTPAHARLAEAFAAQAAIAMENSRLFEAEHAQRERAEALQAQLEQRVAERTAELQSQYARLDAILESTVDGIVVTDHQGTITQTNSIAQSWLTHALTPEDSRKLADNIGALARQTAAGQTGATPPATILELTGIDLELNAALVKRQNTGQATTVVVNIHDVSHLKTMERMKTSFLSNVSHELRTPVTAISLYTHLMQEQPERWTEYLPSLTEATQQQARLVQDIVRLSRLDAGRIALQPEPVPLGQIVGSSLDKHSTTLGAHEITSVYTPPTPDITLRVDRSHFAQALNYLLENAITYTPPHGTLTVTIDTCTMHTRAWATIAITDTGSGISEKELPHIFDRFFRSERIQVQPLANSGLGLTIAQAITKLHGGHITVESQKQHGTTFTIWLPVAPATSQQSPRPDKFLPVR